MFKDRQKWEGELEYTPLNDDDLKQQFYYWLDTDIKTSKIFSNYEIMLVKTFWNKNGIQDN